MRELTDEELSARHALEGGDATRRSRVRELLRTREAVRQAHAAVEAIDRVLEQRERRLERVAGLLGEAYPPSVTGAHQAEAALRAELGLCDKLVQRVEARLEAARSSQDTPAWKRERLEHVVERAQLQQEAAQNGLQSALEAMRLVDEVREDERRARHAYARAVRAYPELRRLFG